MAVYRQPRNGKDFWRTSSYRFTIASKDDKSFIDLKTNISKHNAAVRKRVRTWQKIDDYDKLYTIRLMARGPRRWHTKYKGNLVRYFKGAYGVPQHQKLLHFNADSNLNHQFAEEFDVYIHRSTEMEDALQTEIETGQSPGVQKQIENLKNKIWHLEFKARNNLRDSRVKV